MLRFFSIYISKKTLRNLVLACALSVLLVPSRFVSAAITTPFHCDSASIGPLMAECIGLAMCNPASLGGSDVRRFVFVWVTNNSYCADFSPPVANLVRVDAVVGEPAMTGLATSATVPFGALIADGLIVANCNGLDYKDLHTYFGNCSNPLGNPPPPNACFFPGCFGGSGGGTGGCELDPCCVDPTSCNGGGGGGCDYCAFNWQWDAECRDPYDTNVCGY